MPTFIQQAIGRLRSNQLARAERHRLELYPDTIPYDYDNNEYQSVWRDLNNSANGNYFYTDGYIVTRVGLARNLWESFRGWLGFTNRCEPQRAKMAIQKLAYFGYVRQFDKNHLAAMHDWQPAYQLDATFIQYLGQDRTQKNSAWLQARMMNYYRNHEPALRPNVWQRFFSANHRLFPLVDHDYKFGSAMLDKHELTSCIAKLDPQDDTVIEKLYHQISRNQLLEQAILKGSKLHTNYAFAILNAYLQDKLDWNALLNSFGHLQFKLNLENDKDIATVVDRLIACKNVESILSPNSKLACAFADRILNDYLRAANSWIGKLKNLVGLAQLPEPVLMAVRLNDNLKERRKDFFIEFYLKLENYEQALSLITTLNKLDMAVAFLLRKEIPFDLICKHVEKDSDLGIALANAYMKTVCHKQYKNGDASDQAKHFASHEHLHDTYPAFYFKKFVAHEQFDDAYDLYTANNDKSIFDKAALEKLAGFYHESSQSLRADSKQHSHDDDWEKAEKLMQQSNHAKKLAHLINPANEAYKQNAYTRGYDIGKLIVNSPLYGDTRATRLDLAIKKLSSALKKCDAPMTHKVEHHLLNALYERANLAVEAAMLDYDSDHGVLCNDTHKQKVLSDVQRAISCFEEIIKIDDGEEDQENLAYAHFMLADLHTYFQINDAKEHYQHAMRLMPDNGFYIIRCSEVATNAERRAELQTLGMPILREHNLGASDYLQWFEQRWVKPEKRSVAIAECHAIRKLPEVPGWFAWLSW